MFFGHLTKTCDASHSAWNQTIKTPVIKHQMFHIPKRKNRSHTECFRFGTRFRYTARYVLRFAVKIEPKRRGLFTSCIPQSFSSIFDSLDEIHCYHSYWTRMISRVSSETDHPATECRTSPTCLVSTASRAVLRLSSDAWNVLRSLVLRVTSVSVCLAVSCVSTCVTCSSVRLCLWHVLHAVASFVWVLSVCVTLCSLFALTLWTCECVNV